MTDSNRIIGPVYLDDIRYALEARVEDVSVIPGANQPRWWTGEPPKLDSFGELRFYYRTVDPTEIDLRLVVEHNNGWWYIAAWNDYTGWGCQDGVTCRWAWDLDSLIQFGLEREDRERWGLAEGLDS